MIQGFPVGHIMKGKKADQIVQIGNAVPPPLIKRVVTALLH
jgi:site-specific DNA-cytosine methylase